MNQNRAEFQVPELSVEELTLALYKANHKLSDTILKLKESERMRLELFSNLSHDLRSPITTIRCYVEYLLSFQTLDENEVFLALNQMQDKLLSLDHLMNEILLITTLDSKTKDDLLLTLIPIGSYLEDFFYSCNEDKKYAERNLILQIPDNFNYYVSIDTKLFDRALDNLFTNALKYSKFGDSITLAVYQSEDRIIITVADTGIGIEEKYIKKIFERTYMISDARTPDQTMRYGLGLSIASAIISKHNGEIWCESLPGKGSTFYISLPCVMLQK